MTQFYSYYSRLKRRWEPIAEQHMIKKHGLKPIQDSGIRPAKLKQKTSDRGR
jgi:hypothetical protein